MMLHLIEEEKHSRHQVWESEIEVTGREGHVEKEQWQEGVAALSQRVPLNIKSPTCSRRSKVIMNGTIGTVHGAAPAPSVCGMLGQLL